MKVSLRVISLGAALLALMEISGAVRAAVLDHSAPEQYSATALYNLGNSYARSGNTAMAVLNYERARILAPADPDVRANLRFVREAAGLTAQGGTWLTRNARWANPNTLYWLGLFGLTLAGSGLLLGRLLAGRRVAFTLASIVGVALTVVSVGDALATAPSLREAVILSAAPASASPVIGMPSLFTVPPAEVVSVRAAHAGFALIRDSQGRVGWVARTDLAPVIPDDAPRGKERGEALR